MSFFPLPLTLAAALFIRRRFSGPCSHHAERHRGHCPPCSTRGHRQGGRGRSCAGRRRVQAARLHEESKATTLEQTAKVFKASPRRRLGDKASRKLRRPGRLIFPTLFFFPFLFPYFSPFPGIFLVIWRRLASPCLVLRVT
jgi:hypothetical protein